VGAPHVFWFDWTLSVEWGIGKDGSGKGTKEVSRSQCLEAALNIVLNGFGLDPEKVQNHYRGLSQERMQSNLHLRKSLWQQ
jgi:hypothetical protein